MASKQEKKDAELKAAAKEAEVKEAKEAEAKKKSAIVDVVRGALARSLVGELLGTDCSDCSTVFSHSRFGALR
jgi:hypothetical protein